MVLKFRDFLRRSLSEAVPAPAGASAGGGKRGLADDDIFDVCARLSLGNRIFLIRTGHVTKIPSSVIRTDHGSTRER